MFLLIVILDISNFGFEGGTLVLIASVPGHCLSFTFYKNMHFKTLKQCGNHSGELMRD